VLSRNAVQPYRRITSLYFAMDWATVGVTVDPACVKAESVHEEIVSGSNVFVNEQWYYAFNFIHNFSFA
jgi:hypothetical protein